MGSSMNYISWPLMHSSESVHAGLLQGDRQRVPLVLAGRLGRSQSYILLGHVVAHPGRECTVLPEDTSCPSTASWPLRTKVATYASRCAVFVYMLHVSVHHRYCPLARLIGSWTISLDPTRLTRKGHHHPPLFGPGPDRAARHPVAIYLLGVRAVADYPEKLRSHRGWHAIAALGARRIEDRKGVSRHVALVGLIAIRQFLPGFFSY